MRTMAKKSSATAGIRPSTPTMNKLHPVLVDLGLHQSPPKTQKKTGQGDGKGEKRVTALAVLQKLLQSNVVSEQAVRDAHQAATNANSNDSNQQTAKSSDSKTTQDSIDPATKPTATLPSYRTRHIALQFYYDGSNYSGLAENVGIPTDQSVERQLMAALIKARLIESRETSGYSRCGRTDRGVSAVGQVVAFQLKSAFSQQASWDEAGTDLVETKDLVDNSRDTLTVWAPSRKKRFEQKTLSEYAFDRILNNLLPPDIRILGWSPVTADFSARFSCTTRTYRYFFVRRHLDLAKMNEALQLMVGSHDFRNFCKLDVEKVYNFERRIHAAKIVITPPTGSDNGDDDDGGCGAIAADKQVCYFQILGQAFLWHQIRCIASILFLVGQGLEPPSIVTQLLDVETHPGKPSYNLAPERPLVLHHCGYRQLEMFGYSVPNLWHLYCHFEQQREDLVLAAARIQNCMNRLNDLPMDLFDLTTFVVSKLKMRQKKKGGSDHGTGSTQDMGHPFEQDKSVLWGNAMPWMKERFSLIPDPHGAKDAVHVPLLQRAMGTTYEEKVASVQNSSGKRRVRYESNTKKKKTKEEDQAFYDHMSRQGSSGA